MIAPAKSVAEEIEAFLLERRDWVSASELVTRFNLPTDRPLRSLGDDRGLCSGFAISGNRGFKHVALATRAEWLRFKHRLRRHGIGELVRVRDLDHRRQSVVRRLTSPSPKPPLFFERDSGQELLSLGLECAHTTSAFVRRFH